MKSIVLDIGSEIFPINVNSPISWQSSWLIDSIVNLGTIFGASVGLLGLIGDVVVLSVVVVDEEELGVFVGEGVFEEDWLSVGVGVFEGDGVLVGDGTSVGVGVFEGEGILVGVGVFEGEGILVGVGVFEGEGILVGVGVFEGEGIFVGVGVFEGEGIFVGVVVFVEESVLSVWEVAVGTFVSFSVLFVL